MFKTLLFACLILSSFILIQNPDFEAKAEPQTNGNAQDASPSQITPMPVEFLNKTYPNTQQVWFMLKDADFPLVYRVLIKDQNQKIKADISYCLISYSDGLEWLNSATALEEISTQTAKNNQSLNLAVLDTIPRTNLKAFLETHPSQQVKKLYKVHFSSFMSPQTSGVAGLKMTELEKAEGYCIQIGQQKFWFNTEGLWLEDGFHWHDAVS